MSEFTVHVDDEHFELSATSIQSLDLQQITYDRYHLLHDFQAFDVQVHRMNVLSKTATISVNGNRYDVKIDDVYDRMVEKMGLLAHTSQKVGNIKAPMPGLILDIMVQSGDAIEEGTPLLVLSAMKMENVLLAEGEGVIKSIEVEKGDAVDKGQLIIEME
ncbi:acetyl-CoA carboxylase biotin carboxyl carrier protein subunit [Aggregatimonas sangjinii]|uniref:Acetyl-CoA carboxylase biotin carboxyl carrier protein subunit n=1 Tax=Aggregatimonas sangjinii TaxID=2583587 RepID=A0A5B7SJU2_9FLAO|nr:acetyl-CoA carboxylase biotin carboxyl carrier protein subunit [Aggregatimonas sangjinii]QCW98696.1 acetyl-CoA carboxylase biotin carboxyl carrier protein subunit [Aggregatimonas sangjinii]